MAAPLDLLQIIKFISNNKISIENRHDTRSVYGGQNSPALSVCSIGNEQKGTTFIIHKNFREQ